MTTICARCDQEIRLDSGHWVTEERGEADCPAAYNEDGSLREENTHGITSCVDIFDNSHHPKEVEEVEDAYAAHVARLREQRAQAPEEMDKFDVSFSKDAMDFMSAALELVRPTTRAGELAKLEIENELLAAVRKRIREQELRRGSSLEEERAEAEVAT